METDGLEIVDGRIIEKGPIAIVATQEDITQWSKLENAWQTKDSFWDAFIAAGAFVGLLFGGGFFVLFLVFDVIVSHRFNIPTSQTMAAHVINLTVSVYDFAAEMKHLHPQWYVPTLVTLCVVVCAAYAAATRWIINPKRRRLKEAFDGERRALLAKYGDFPLVDDIAVVGQHGWRTKKYALIAKKP